MKLPFLNKQAMLSYIINVLAFNAMCSLACFVYANMPYVKLNILKLPEQEFLSFLLFFLFYNMPSIHLIYTFTQVAYTSN